MELALHSVALASNLSLRGTWWALEEEGNMLNYILPLGA